MGSYQAYLRNDKQPMARYIRVSERYGRPGIAAFGARFLLDSTSYLPNSTQSRTELLPQFKPPLSYNGYQNVSSRAKSCSAMLPATAAGRMPRRQNATTADPPLVLGCCEPFDTLAAASK